MRVAITGASGLIGTELGDAWRREGDDVVAISRRPQPGAIHWVPARGVIDAKALEGFDVVVNLAGESLDGGRWSERRKHLIWHSRERATDLLSETLARCRRPPRVLLSASAVGFYGSREDEWLDESVPSGSDFLARLCLAWEDACNPARAAGIRVVHTRFGMILSAHGGALGRMLPIFRLGLGGRFGDGQQWMSWMAIDDLIGAMQHAIANESLRGPVNFVSPAPVRNADFARILGHALHRPTVLPVPKVALHVALGEMADATVLASQRVRPGALDTTGFRCQFPELASALGHVLKGG